MKQEIIETTQLLKYFKNNTTYHAMSADISSNPATVGVMALYPAAVSVLEPELPTVAVAAPPVE
jgi:hypothetical protein